MPTNRIWLWLPVGAFGGAIAFAALAPEDWQIRLGLHWLVEHFLAFFALTVLACVAVPRPMLVAGVLLPLAVGIEAAQGLTPDRTPDTATALIAAAAVACGGLLADLVLAVRKKRGTG